jgi:hypothetical protein
LSVAIVIEGDTDKPVALKLVEDAGLEVGQVYDLGGKSQIDLRVKDFNNSAKGSPWFVLRDLDHDAVCAPTFVRGMKLNAARWMVFRIAVREVEAWLMADHVGLADFMGVVPSAIPQDPDAHDHPTEALVNLARKSKKRAIVQAFVPRQGDQVSVGPLYEASIIEFAERHWSLDRACRRSPSLKSAREALGTLGVQWSRHTRGTAGR